MHRTVARRSAGSSVAATGGILGLVQTILTLLKHASNALFALAQRFLGLLALGDVHVGAGHAVGLAAGVAEGHAAGQYPAIRPILVPQPILVFVMWRRAFDVGHVGGHDALALFGMQPLLPFLDAVRNLVVLVAEDALPAWRVKNFAGIQVPIPESILRAGDGQLEALATAT